MRYSQGKACIQTHKYYVALRAGNASIQWYPPFPSDPTIIIGLYGHGGDAFESSVRSYKNDDLRTAFTYAVNSCK